MEKSCTKVIDMYGYELTSRERLILEFMTEGYENNEIAAKIYVSIHTVKAHVSTIIKKLNAKNRTEAACKAVRIGICWLCMHKFDEFLTFLNVS